MNWVKDWYARNTNPDKEKGNVHDVIKGADVFFGLSAPGVIDDDDLKNMAKDPIVFAMANPMPEIMPEDAAGTRCRDGDRPIGLSKSDQQRPLLPRHFSRCSELPCFADQRSDEARRR